MADVRFTPAALRDLENIWNYTTQQWGEEQAVRYLDALNTGFEALAVTPLSGSTCEHIRVGYRRLRVERHSLYYRIESTLVIVVRVLHERMDVPRHL